MFYNQQKLTVGCCCGPHVYDNGTFADMIKQGFEFKISKSQKIEKSDINKCNLLAIDCEMCYTIGGFELGRVTIVDESSQIIYDHLVKPLYSVIDYNFEFSGLTPEFPSKATKTFEQAQQDILNLINSETILVGQSLESDLKTLRVLFVF